MTVTGYVFLFLTLILAIVFPGLAQPVFEYNRTNQKTIVAEEAKIGVLSQEVVDLERKRKSLRDQVALEERRRTTAEENARRSRLSKETEHTFLKDALVDSEIRATSWRSALAQTDAEVNARDAEIKEMDVEVQQATTFGSELAQQVADLKSKLESSKSLRSKLAAELQEREKDLAAIMKKQPDLPDDDVANLDR